MQGKTNILVECYIPRTKDGSTRQELIATLQVDLTTSLSSIADSVKEYLNI